MKHTRKIITGILLLLMSLTALTAMPACGGGGGGASPEDVAKSYVKSQADMNTDLMLKISSFSREMTSEQKKAVKAAANAMQSLLPDTMKAQTKSTNFVKYEKVSGDATTEVGNVTISYKPNGTGDVEERTDSVSFIKIGGKWYLNQENPFA